jgi:hypothetical protein
VSSTSVDDEAEAEVEVEVEAREDEGQVRVGRVPEVVQQERKENAVATKCIPPPPPLERQ